MESPRTSNPPGFLAALVRQRRWSFATSADEDTGRAWLRTLREREPPVNPASRLNTSNLTNEPYREGGPVHVAAILEKVLSKRDTESASQTSTAHIAHSAVSRESCSRTQSVTLRNSGRTGRMYTSAMSELEECPSQRFTSLIEAQGRDPNSVAPRWRSV